MTFIPENLIILIVDTYVLGIFLKKMEYEAFILVS